MDHTVKPSVIIRDAAARIQSGKAEYSCHAIEDAAWQLARLRRRESLPLKYEYETHCRDRRGYRPKWWDSSDHSVTRPLRTAALFRFADHLASQGR